MAQRHQVDVATPALDRFLSEPAARQLLGDELGRVLSEAFLPPGYEAQYPRQEDLRWRVLVCWRLARGIALVLGLCAEDEPLERAADAEDYAESPWTFPTAPRLSPSQQQLVRLGEATDMHRLAAGGVTLLPPADPALARAWCPVAAVLAEELGVAASEGGAAGLRGLLDPRTCGHAGVTPKMVVGLEELLVDEAARAILECGERATVEHLRGRYGLARREAAALVRLARADAMRGGSSSVEEDRALMVLMLKDLAARTKEEMNTDKELRVLKELARVQGLTRSEPEDLGRLFAGVIAGVAERQDRRLLESQRRIVDADAVDVTPEPAVDSGDEDPAALAEFDREET